jgi:hypothetical protein
MVPAKTTTGKLFFPCLLQKSLLDGFSQAKVSLVFPAHFSFPAAAFPLIFRMYMYAHNVRSMCAHFPRLFSKESSGGDVRDESTSRSI